MRIYLAAMSSRLAGFSPNGTTNPNKVAGDAMARTYPWKLESYHYLKDNPRAAPYFREQKETLFMDSGAFTMFTKGIALDLGQYAEFLARNHDWIHVASNVDEIGRHKEAESYRNQKELERLGADVCPVHHARDADKWLQKYLADGYEYIFLGGMVPETTKYLLGWLDHVWEKYLTNKDGTARIKVHGFGLTTFTLMFRYPWFSVDSTSWVQHGSFGCIMMDFPDGRVQRIVVSQDSPMVHDFDRHMDTMSPPEQKYVRQQIEARGYDPELLRTHYGWRDNWNIAFFQRVCRINPVFERKQRGVFD